MKNGKGEKAVNAAYSFKRLVSEIQKADKMTTGSLTGIRGSWLLLSRGFLGCKFMK